MALNNQGKAGTHTALKNFAGHPGLEVRGREGLKQLGESPQRCV